MKNWYESKSIWAQVVAFIATMTTLFGIDLQLTPEVQTAIAAGVQAIVAVVMRFVTKDPIV